MDKFIEQHADRINGTLGCFDRMLFRGYLPIMSGAAMATFLKSRDVKRETLKAFLLEQAERLKRHAQDLCAQAGRPYEYLGHVARKEDLARKIAERDEIAEGLVCVLSVLEPCRTFSLVWNGHSPYVQSTKRKCLHFYYYFVDPRPGPHPRQVAELVPVSDPGLRQRSRVAGSATRSTRRQAHEAG